jgi:hypothetical protein
MAKPSGNRRAFAGLEVGMAVKNFADSLKKVNVFGRAIERVSALIKGSTVEQANAFDWSAAAVESSHKKTAGLWMKAAYLYENAREKLDAFHDGQLKVSDLGEDEVKVLKATHKEQEKLLRQRAMQEKQFGPLKARMEQRQRYLNAMVSKIADVEAKEKELNKVHERAIKVASELSNIFPNIFSPFIEGSVEANEVLGAFSGSLEKAKLVGSKLVGVYELFAGPVMGRVKKRLAEAMVDLGGSGISKFVAKMGEEIGGAGVLKAKKVPVAKKLPGLLPRDIISMKDWVKIPKMGSKVEASMAATTKAMASSGRAAGSASSAMAGLATSGGSLARVFAVLLAPEVIVIGIVLAAIIPIVAAIYIGLNLLVKGIKSNIKEMERFRTVGFRAAGSIRDLLEVSRDLGMALGTSAEQAYGTVQALGEAGFAVTTLGEKLTTLDGTIVEGNDALVRLSKANLMFSDATGVSGKTTALLQKRMNVMNMTAEEQEGILGALTLAAKKYGLSASDLSSVVQNLRKHSMQLEVVWSDTNRFEYAKAMGTLSGAVKQLGVDASVAARIQDDLANANKRVLMIAAQAGGLGTFFKGDQVAQMDAMAAGAGKILERAQKMPGILRARYLNIFGGAEYLKTLDTYSKMTEEEISLEKARAAAIAEYDASTRTLSKSLQRLFAPILFLAAEIAEPLVDVVIDMARSAMPPVTDLVKGLKDLWRGFKTAMAPIREFLNRISGKVFDNFSKGMSKIGDMLTKVGQSLSENDQLFKGLEKTLDLIIKNVGEFGDKLGNMTQEDVEKWTQDVFNGMVNIGKAIYYLVGALAAAVDLMAKFGSFMDKYDLSLFDLTSPTTMLYKMGKSAVGGKGGGLGPAFTNIVDQKKQMTPASVYDSPTDSVVMSGTASKIATQMVEQNRILAEIAKKGNDPNNERTANYTKELVEEMKKPKTQKELPTLRKKNDYSGEKMNWWNG